ncbi:MAG: hypothetical protein II865_07260, partial [Bacteroidales bacterium]|nr:hypothetical protein [Bacteroidales bacterium]
FIGNHSSGLMGIEIARAFADQGADVTLVLGPSSIRPVLSILINLFFFFCLSRLYRLRISKKSLSICYIFLHSFNEPPKFPAPRPSRACALFPSHLGPQKYTLEHYIRLPLPTFF